MFPKSEAEQEATRNETIADEEATEAGTQHDEEERTTAWKTDATGFFK